MKLFVFDRDYAIAIYYTVYAENPVDALIMLKSYLRRRAKAERTKGEAYYEYQKWRTATIYDLPENYRIEEYDPLQVMQHERI